MYVPTKRNDILKKYSGIEKKEEGENVAILERFRANIEKCYYKHPKKTVNIIS